MALQGLKLVDYIFVAHINLTAKVLVPMQYTNSCSPRSTNLGHVLQSLINMCLVSILKFTLNCTLLKYRSMFKVRHQIRHIQSRAPITGLEKYKSVQINHVQGDRNHEDCNYFFRNFIPKIEIDVIFSSQKLTQTYYQESIITVHFSSLSTQNQDMCLGTIGCGLIEIQSQHDRNSNNLQITNEVLIGTKMKHLSR